MFSFIVDLWSWLPEPFPVVFNGLLVAFVFWFIFSIVISIIDLIPFV